MILKLNIKEVIGEIDFLIELFEEHLEVINDREMKEDYSRTLGALQICRDIVIKKKKEKEKLFKELDDLSIDDLFILRRHLNKVLNLKLQEREKNKINNKKEN